MASINGSNMKKLTFSMLVHEYIEFYSEHLRFGQYMFNKYYCHSIERWPKLFYEEDAVKAFELLEQRIKRDNA